MYDEPTTRPRSDARATFLADILTTAVEGGYCGSGCWADLADYAWRSAGIGAYNAPPAGQDYAAAVLVERETGARHVVTLDTVARGLSRIRRGQVEISARVRAMIVQAERHPDDADLDSDVCDRIVQAGALGAIVYG